MGRVKGGWGLGKNRPPLPPGRTMAELAGEFGLSSLSLSRQYSASKLDKPSAMPKSGAKTYYPYEQMKDWWKRHQASKTKE